jgi:hypothetical protein
MDSMSDGSDPSATHCQCAESERLSQQRRMFTFRQGPDRQKQQQHL